MARPSIPAFLLCFLLPLLLPSSAQNCLSDTSFSQNRLYAKCSNLANLSAALHWTYHPSNGTIDIAYRASQTSSGWVAWAINPTGTQMTGAQSLIAFHDSTGVMTVYAVPISAGYSPTMKDGTLSFKVYSKDAEFSNSMITIYATVALPSNKTQVNQVWQAGTQFSGGVPSGHAITGVIQSYGTLDILSGLSSGSGDNSRQHRKNASHTVSQPLLH